MERLLLALLVLCQRLRFHWHEWRGHPAAALCQDDSSGDLYCTACGAHWRYAEWGDVIEGLGGDDD